MNTELSKKIDFFISKNSDNILRDISRLVSIDSVSGKPAENVPYGIGPRRALELALDIASELGLDTANFENKLGYAELGKGNEYIATITHVDVVPAGEGWTGNPFKMIERDGWIIGRGVLDNKGPTVLCLYALKYLKESGLHLKYPIRALIGSCEETGMYDVHSYLAANPAPVFCFSPDSSFPLINGEKGLFNGLIRSKVCPENVVEINGGLAFNAVPDKAYALVKTNKPLKSCENVAVEKQGELWRVSATGIAGHASTPQGTVNAIGVLVDYLLAKNIPSESERGFFEAISLLHASTAGDMIGCAAADGIFTPLTIVGGMIGIKDGRFFQSVDSRFTTDTSAAKISAGISASMGDAIEFEVLSESAPFYISVDNPAIQACINAYNSVTEENKKPFTIGGGTYARHFPNAVSFGPEHVDRPVPEFAGRIHGVDEAASIDALLEALKIYIVALLKLEELDY